MSEWTKTPPTEPGWYWWRHEGLQESMQVVIFEDGLTYFAGFTCGREKPDGEWWTTKIEEPK